MMVQRDRRPEAHTLKIVVHELTGPNRMNVHHFDATAKPSAGKARLKPADQQRLAGVLGRMAQPR